MGFRGTGLGALGARLRDLASVPARAIAALTPKLLALLQEEFDTGTDPYGRPWRELAESTLAKGRTPPPLDDTGAMRGGAAVTPLRGAGVAIVVPLPGAYHQTGWAGPQGSGPARPILPTGTMPRRWSEAIREAVDAEVSR